MKMKKIVQIVFRHSAILYAVCEDGTIWVKNLEDSKNAWKEIEGIPDV